MREARWVMAGVLLLLAAACCDDDKKDGKFPMPDATAIVDGSVPIDGTMVDGTMVDGAMVDAAMPDGAMVDAPPVDMSMDAPMTDGAVDANKPDAATVLDFAKFDTKGADLLVPDLVVVPDLVSVTDAPKAFYYAHQNWVDACKNLTACGLWRAVSPGGNSRGLSDCIALEPKLGSLPIYPKNQLLCLQMANATCAQIEQCLAGAIMPPTCDQAKGGVNKMCAGNTYSFCSNINVVSSFECTQIDQKCIVGTNNNVGCGFATCNQDGLTGCVQGYRTQCSGGRESANEDCRVFSGEFCDASTGQGLCTGSGPACTGSGTRCDGGKVVACKNGKEATYDCTGLAVGYTCVGSSPGAKCAYGTACSATTHPGTCNGNVLTYCDAGKVATIDCVASGFSSCVPAGAADGGIGFFGGYCKK